MAGRDVCSSQGFTGSESFKERRAANGFLKIKHLKTNKMSKSVKYVKMHVTELNGGLWV